MQNWRDFLHDDERRELELCEATIKTIDAYRRNLSNKYQRIVTNGFLLGREVRKNSAPVRKLSAEIESQEASRKRYEEKRRTIQQRAAERARYASRREAAA